MKKQLPDRLTGILTVALLAIAPAGIIFLASHPPEYARQHRKIEVHTQYENPAYAPLADISCFSLPDVTHVYRKPGDD